MLTDDEARKLATQVVKQGENDVRVKFGKTNGKNCLHIKSRKQSSTIYSADEWAESPLNISTRKREKKERRVENDELGITHTSKGGSE